jgi:hypothetical protein
MLRTSCSLYRPPGSQGASEIIMRFGDDELWKREGRHGDDGPSISGMTKENKKIARDQKVRNMIVLQLGSATSIQGLL